jgi:Flp pilus assembly protein TadD/TolB-like protein
MQDKAQDDDQVMSLVEQALARAADDRDSYLRNACGDNSELLERVRDYVTWEERMSGFLLEPLIGADAYDHPFKPGELLDDRFRIVREVAQGGMGIVYEAMDEKLERRVALKCAKIGFHQRLNPEVRNATEISHPNVCKLFEIHTASTTQGDIDFLTMEFLEGETLAQRLRRGRLPEGESRTIARQLCAGLAEAHRNQVIHGDLKSNNVILTAGADGANRAVITDFGLAHRPEAAQQTEQSGEIGGTPDYMAPELLKGEKASVASDIYALGVILHELACGQRPRQSKGSEPAKKGKEQLVQKPPTLHPKWDRILARCLDGDPSRRYHDADEVAAALGPSHSRRWLLAAAAAAVLAVVSGVVTYQRATTPRESVRLAILPFEADRGAAQVADGLFRDTAGQLVRLRGNARTKLAIIPPSKTLRDHVDTADKARILLGATHVLHGTLNKENDRLVVHAYLTDARSHVNTKDWTAEYAPEEIRYAPVALAGLVTGTLRLPPSIAATVNADARKDYLAGLAYVRRDTGVDTALAFLERAVAADPDSPLTHAALAEAQWFKYFLTREQSWLDRAAESVREAELRNPDLAPVHRIAGLLWANAGRYEQAEAEYRRAAELEPNHSDAFRRLGQVLERNSRFEEALAAYRQALDAEPGYYRTYQALGGLYFRKGDYDEAVKYLGKTVEIAPDEPAGHIALGTTLTNLGRFAEAESEFRFALHLRETPPVLHALGLALMYQSKDREAIPYFLSALKLSPDRFLSWMELGNCYRRLKQAADAKRANLRGLELVETEMARNPRDGYARSHLAYLCARLGDRRRAESEIAQALQLSPNGADTRGLAVFTYEALGMRDATLAVLATAPIEVIKDLSRWPDVADLHKDPRFLQLLTSNQRR